MCYCRDMIKRKSKYELKLMKAAGEIVAMAHEAVKDAVKEGISTWELDEIVYNLIIKNKAIPTFKGYAGFPNSICASINSQVVHGIPSEKDILKDGDILVGSGLLNTVDYVICFTNLGNYIAVPVHKLTENRWKDEGTHLNEYSNLNSGEKIIKVIGLNILLYFFL